MADIYLINFPSSFSNICLYNILNGVRFFSIHYDLLTTNGARENVDSNGIAFYRLYNIYTAIFELSEFVFYLLTITRVYRYRSIKSILPTSITELNQKTLRKCD